MTFHVVVVVFLCCGYSCVGLYHIPLSCCQVRMDPGANVLDGFLRDTGSAEQYGCQQRGIGESFLFHGSLLVCDCNRMRKESTSGTADSSRYLSATISEVDGGIAFFPFESRLCATQRRPAILFIPNEPNLEPS